MHSSSSLPQDPLQEQIERLKENRLKNANQICDQIYIRQYNRLKSNYQEIKKDRDKVVKDSTHQEEVLAKIENKVHDEFRIYQEFKKMKYFGFTELQDMSKSLKQEDMNSEKLKGRYKLKIRESLPPSLRISQFANEPVAFHLHKKRDFFTRLDGKLNQNMKEDAKLKEEIQRIRKRMELYKLQKILEKQAKLEVEQQSNRKQSLWKQYLSDKNQSQDPRRLSVLSINKESQLLPNINSSLDISLLNDSSILSINNQNSAYKKSRKTAMERNDYSRNDFQKINQSSVIKLKPMFDKEHQNSSSTLNYKDSIQDQVNIKQDESESKDQKVTSEKSKSIFASLFSLKSQNIIQPSQMSLFNNTKTLDESQDNINILIHQSSLDPYDDDPQPKVAAFNPIFNNFKKGFENVAAKENIRTSLQTIQKKCSESNAEITIKLDKIRKSLDREELYKSNMDFTVKTLQEFDNIEPHGLDIIFEYKVGDADFQKEEASLVAKEYKNRDNNPMRHIIARLELENGARNRKKSRKARYTT